MAEKQFRKLSADEAFGMAKRIHRELSEVEPMDHGAVLSVLTSMAKHREASMQFEQHTRQQEAQDQAMDAARKAHAAAQAKREDDEFRARAAESGIELVGA